MVRYGNNTMEDPNMRSYARLQSAAGERPSYIGPREGYAERAHLIPSQPRKTYELPIDDRTTGSYSGRAKPDEEIQARNQKLYSQLCDGTYSMN